jgi:predicted patatin/cPLA2 family phospholipase
MNLTYYLAKQPEGVKAYQEDLVDGAFLDLKRLPKTRRSRRLMGTSRGRAPAMDVSYLVDGVMDGATGRALRWSDVLASTVAFNVVATSLDTLTPVILHSPFKDVADLKQALKASAAVPLFAGPKPVRHRGQRLVDAAVMEPVPIHAAAADGCTHVLVLLTRVLDDSSQETRRETRRERREGRRSDRSSPARSDRSRTPRCAAR